MRRGQHLPGQLQLRRPGMTTTNELLAEEAAISILLLAGTYLDQGLSMEQTIAVLHKAVDLVPQLGEDVD